MEKPEFSKTSEENLVSIERDAFSSAEVTKIFSLPLFTGCKSADRIWVSGNYLVQNHLYWGYVLAFFTGLRPGEIGQIDPNDIEEEDGIYYLQPRGFNPRKRRRTLLLEPEGGPSAKLQVLATLLPSIGADFPKSAHRPHLTNKLPDLP